MRKTFIDTLIELARQDKDIFLLTGDLGYSVFEDFAKEFPARFINCGVMEQSMMSIAAGLALGGKKPYVYSIIPFATMRPFEQIRNDLCYQNLNVKIIGIGAGFAYGPLASTHYAIEDIAILRSLPNISIFSPADAVETKALTLQSYQHPGPAYLRLLKPETTFVPEGVTTISKPSVIQEGPDGLIITTGAALALGITVAKKLKEQSKYATLVSLHTLKPVNEELLLKILSKHSRVFTIEEHRIRGGLSSIVAEVIAYHALPVKLHSFGVDNSYTPLFGHQDFLAAHYGLDPENIFKHIVKVL